MLQLQLLGNVAAAEGGPEGLNKLCALMSSATGGGCTAAASCGLFQVVAVGLDLCLVQADEAMQVARRLANLLQEAACTQPGGQQEQAARSSGAGAAAGEASSTVAKAAAEGLLALIADRPALQLEVLQQTPAGPAVTAMLARPVLASAMLALLQSCASCDSLVLEALVAQPGLLQALLTLVRKPREQEVEGEQQVGEEEQAQQCAAAVRVVCMLVEGRESQQLAVVREVGMCEVLAQLLSSESGEVCSEVTLLVMVLRHSSSSEVREAVKKACSEAGWR